MRTDPQGNLIAIARFVGNPTVLALSTSSANVQLPANTYFRIVSDVNCFFQFGNSSGVVAGNQTSNPLFTPLDLLVATDATNVWLAAIAGSAGHLYISQLEVYTS